MNPQPTKRSLLRVTQVAERLQIGRSTLYLLLQRGCPPEVVHIGESIRITADSVDTFIASLAGQEVREDVWPPDSHAA